MLIKEVYYFLSECFDLVMFLLFLYVFDQSIFRFDGVCKRTITVLPATKVGKDFVVLDEIR
jgi:hypothetical protein